MDAKFFVPFETAKALKEKGYNEQCSYYYGDGIIRRVSQYPCTNEQLSDNTPNWLFNECISAPTYHEVVDWLEKKGKYIFAEFRAYENDWAGFVRGINGELEYLTEFPTREEALNEGILKALEML